MIVPTGVLQGLAFLGIISLGIYLVERLRGTFRKTAAAPSGGYSAAALRARMKRLARPTLLLVNTTSPGFSKVGGLPELPAGMTWPTGAREAPAFVAQIDLESLREHVVFDWLPETGRLYLFFDDWLNGAPNCGRVVFTREAPGPPLDFPPDLARKRRFGERRVGVREFMSFPSQDWLNENWPANIDWTGLAERADFGGAVEHRVGGYPSEIQGGQLALECEHLWRGRTMDYSLPVPDAIRHAARQWRLLIQIDSDDALSMNWWDGGRLYVFIRARDAKRGDFSKTVTITQTH